MCEGNTETCVYKSRKRLTKRKLTPLCLFKGLRPPENDASADHTEVADLVFQWKKNLKRQRAIEALTASRDELGLRRREKHLSTPSLVDIVNV